MSSIWPVRPLSHRLFALRLAGDPGFGSDQSIAGAMLVLSQTKYLPEPGELIPITRPGALFLDAVEIQQSECLRAQLLTWGLEQGYIRHDTNLRVMFIDSDWDGPDLSEKDVVPETLLDSSHRSEVEALVAEPLALCVMREEPGYAAEPALCQAVGHEHIDPTGILLALAERYAAQELAVDGVWFGGGSPRFALPAGKVFRAEDWEASPAVHRRLPEPPRTDLAGLEIPF